MNGSDDGGRRMEAAPVPYERFRSGLTFESIRRELQAEQAIQNRRAALGLSDYMFVTRRTVLGRWQQQKRELWERYCDSFEAGAEIGRGENAAAERAERNGGNPDAGRIARPGGIDQRDGGGADGFA